MSSHFFDVEELTKHFGGLRAIHEVSFFINRDEIVGLIGPNGAGKTTLIRLIIGILKPDSGKIRLNGKSINGLKPWTIVHMGVASTFQVVKPFRKLPVISNVMVGCLGSRNSKKTGNWLKETEAKALDALDFLGIADLALERASVLSHGDLKRLEIARAIVTEPELLILDEPFGGLNAAETELVGESIKRLHKGGRIGGLESEGPAMIIVEHKLKELMKIVNRVMVLNYGEIIAIDTPQEIVRNEKVIQAYIGAEVAGAP